MASTEFTEDELRDWKGEHWSLVGPSWKGFKDIRHLIIFGDSYSQTNSAMRPHGAPSEQLPLGLPFPGNTSTEGPENWVGHLVHERKPPILVFNYATNGHTVSGINYQIRQKFLELNPPTFSWSGQDTLFVTWVGINDLAFSQDHETILGRLFELQWQLYEKGARNFLFIDVPCIDRSPAYKVVPTPERRARFPAYNLTLERKIRQFVSDTSEPGKDPITALYFSSHKVFTSLLDTPEEYGFPPDHVKRSGGSIWADHLHPTSVVHAILAAELEKFLNEVNMSAQ
ncbi:hypothetical protein CPB86DRAFT_823124 [Serendipita vermifera]|nr:hypothetical protein CPB86DRAFT_823124 [Serendipita vermifera]